MKVNDCAGHCYNLMYLTFKVYVEDFVMLIKTKERLNYLGRLAND